MSRAHGTPAGSTIEKVGGIGPQVHVRLDLAGQAFDGRAVEPFAVGQDGLDPPRRDRDGLDRAGHVRELQLDLLDAGIADDRQDALEGQPVRVANGSSGRAARCGLAGLGAAPAPLF